MPRRTGHHTTAISGARHSDAVPKCDVLRQPAAMPIRTSCSQRTHAHAIPYKHVPSLLTEGPTSASGLACQRGQLPRRRFALGVSFRRRRDLGSQGQNLTVSITMPAETKAVVQRGVDVPDTGPARRPARKASRTVTRSSRARRSSVFRPGFARQRRAVRRNQERGAGWRAYVRGYVRP